jgi:hypothetical protein
LNSKEIKQITFSFKTRMGLFISGEYCDVTTGEISLGLLFYRKVCFFVRAMSHDHQVGFISFHSNYVNDMYNLFYLNDVR